MQFYGSCLQLSPSPHDSPESHFQWPGGDLPFPSVCSRFYCSDSGTFSLCSSQLGNELSLKFFNVVATITTACVVLLWILVAVRTSIEGWKGEIFYAPCLASVGDRIPESIDMTERQATNSNSEH